MDKYKMTSCCEDIVVYDSIEAAINANDEKIRVDLQGKRLKTLPKGFEALAKIPYLELDLSYNKNIDVWGLFRQLYELQNLRWLSLKYCEIKEITFFEMPDRIKHVKYLDLSHNQLVKISMSDSDLDFIDLSDNQLYDTVRVKANKINIENNINLTSDGFSELQDYLSREDYINLFLTLPHLKDIRLHGNKDISPELGRCTHIEKIRLSWNPFGSSIQETFKNLINLKEIEIDNVEKKDILPDIFANLPNLHTVKLRHCNAKLPKSFYESSVKSLYVEYYFQNEVVDISKVIHLSKIEKLNIKGGFLSLTEQDFYEMSQCVHLKHLNFSTTLQISSLPFDFPYLTHYETDKFIPSTNVEVNIGRLRWSIFPALLSP